MDTTTTTTGSCATTLYTLRSPDGYDCIHFRVVRADGNVAHVKAQCVSLDEGDVESGPTCRVNEYDLDPATARQWWREARDDGWRVDR